MVVGDDLERDYYGSEVAGMKPVLIDRNGKYAKHPSLRRISSLLEVPSLL